MNLRALCPPAPQSSMLKFDRKTSNADLGLSTHRVNIEMGGGEGDDVSIPDYLCQGWTRF